MLTGFVEKYFQISGDRERKVNKASFQGYKSLLNSKGIKDSLASETKQQQIITYFLWTKVEDVEDINIKSCFFPQVLKSFFNLYQKFKKCVVW